MDSNLTFYTDGAVKNNKYSSKGGQFGGIGVYCKELNLEIYKKYPNATNNKMELMAILEALEYIHINGLFNKKIVIYSDSNYSIKCCNIWYPNWVKNNKLSDKKNLSIIQKIVEYLDSFENVKLIWCKGHSGIAGNEIADELANKALKEI